MTSSSPITCFRRVCPKVTSPKRRCALRPAGDLRVSRPYSVLLSDDRDGVDRYRCRPIGEGDGVCRAVVVAVIDVIESIPLIAVAIVAIEGLAVDVTDDVTTK